MSEHQSVEAYSAVPADPKKTAGGFTLVEILVALFVMLVGISSAFALFAAATALHKRATDQSSAAVIAEVRTYCWS